MPQERNSRLSLKWIRLPSVQLSHLGDLPECHVPQLEPGELDFKLVLLLGKLPKQHGAALSLWPPLHEGAAKHSSPVELLDCRRALVKEAREDVIFISAGGSG